MTNNRRLVIIIGFIVLLVLGLAIYVSISNNQRFRLIGSIPTTNGNIPTSTGVMRLNFNRKLKDIDYSQKIDGNESNIVTSTKVEGTTLLVYLTTLEENKSYRFNINSVTSETGEVINKVSVNVLAVYVPYDKLPKEQQDLEASQTDQNNHSDPILALLPHQGNQFYLEASYVEDDDGVVQLILEAQLFLSRDEVPQNREQVINSYEQRVFEFIKSNQLNPDNYHIRYTVNEPPVSTGQ